MSRHLMTLCPGAKNLVPNDLYFASFRTKRSHLNNGISTFLEATSISFKLDHFKRAKLTLSFPIRNFQKSRLYLMVKMLTTKTVIRD